MMHMSPPCSVHRWAQKQISSGLILSWNNHLDQMAVVTYWGRSSCTIWVWGRLKSRRVSPNDWHGFSIFWDLQDHPFLSCPPPFWSLSRHTLSVRQTVLRRYSLKWGDNQTDVHISKTKHSQGMSQFLLPFFFNIKAMKKYIMYARHLQANVDRGQCTLYIGANHWKPSTTLSDVSEPSIEGAPPDHR